MKVINIIAAFAMILTSLVGYAATPDDYQHLMISAHSCTTIPARLERLHCFDNIFKTAVNIDQHDFQLVSNQSPSWFRAKESEKKRTADTPNFILSYENPQDPGLGMWLTTPAFSNDNHEVIVMFSCIDNISRIEIILPSVVNDARIPVTVDGTQSRTQNWTTDDSGYVVRSGRGLYAIELMKVMIGTQKINFRSSSPLINGLSINTENIDEYLQPLRHVCRW